MTSAASTTDSTTGADASGTTEPTQLEKLRAKYPWLDHLIRAATRYTEKHGDHYAAAITFFSILALVPLLMVAFAAAAFVLANNQAMLTEIQNAITAAVPAGLGDLLNSVIDQAIAQRNAVGIIGLLGALFSGLGWMSNLREALSEQWDQRGEPPSIVKRYGSDLLAMVGLGLAFGLSFAITGSAPGSRPRSSSSWDSATRPGRGSCSSSPAWSSPSPRTGWCSSGSSPGCPASR